MSKEFVYPWFWIPHWWVKRALTGYPLYDVPHKMRERDLPETLARENFEYFLRVKRARLAFFQRWLHRNFRVDASLTPTGVEAVNRWVGRFGGGLIGDETYTATIFASYAPRWEGRYAGYNVMVDLGIFMGEYAIFRQPKLHWEMYQGHEIEPASFKLIGYRRPCLAGLPHKWKKDILTLGYGIVADIRQTCMIGHPLSLNNQDAVIAHLKSTLYSARLTDDVVTFGESKNEPL